MMSNSPSAVKCDVVLSVATHVVAAVEMSASAIGMRNLTFDWRSASMPLVAAMYTGLAMMAAATVHSTKIVAKNCWVRFLGAARMPDRPTAAAKSMDPTAAVGRRVSGRPLFVCSVSARMTLRPLIAARTCGCIVLRARH